MKNYINWKIFFILMIMGLVSVFCVFPYIISVQGELLNKTGIPIQTIFLAQFIQCIILFSITIFFGLFFIKKINFQIPLIETIIKKENYNKVLKSILLKSILIGIATAITIYLLDIVFTMSGVSISTHQNYAPIWQKLLASFYGGITEEILMRLFLMTFFIWIIAKIFKQNQPTKINIIISIFLAAIIFGFGHLPITASLTELSPLVVARAIILNGIGGVIFGWLFWKKGFESAIIAHFTADVFLLTILPLVIK